MIFVRVECKDNRIQTSVQVGELYSVHSFKPADLYRGHILEEHFKRQTRQFPRRAQSTVFNLLCCKAAELKQIIKDAAIEHNLPH